VPSALQKLVEKQLGALETRVCFFTWMSVKAEQTGFWGEQYRKVCQKYEITRSCWLTLDNIGFLEQKSYLQSAERRGANQTRLLPRVTAGGFAASLKKKILTTNTQKGLFRYEQKKHLLCFKE